jgi:hypothetical protein
MLNMLSRDMGQTTMKPNALDSHAAWGSKQQRSINDTTKPNSTEVQNAALMRRHRRGRYFFLMKQCFSSVDNSIISPCMGQSCLLVCPQKHPHTEDETLRKGEEAPGQPPCFAYIQYKHSDHPDPRPMPTAVSQATSSSKPLRWTTI